MLPAHYIPFLIPTAYAAHSLRLFLDYIKVYCSPAGVYNDDESDTMN
jgi:hypothetical protein